MFAKKQIRDKIKRTSKFKLPPTSYVSFTKSQPTMHISQTLDQLTNMAIPSLHRVCGTSDL